MEQYLDLPDVSFPDIPATSAEEIERVASEEAPEGRPQAIGPQ
jgi:hypothetical protein